MGIANEDFANLFLGYRKVEHAFVIVITNSNVSNCLFIYLQMASGPIGYIEKCKNMAYI